MKPKPPTWPSEAAMLTAFAAEAAAMGFRCVPESCGHDLVLIAGPDIEAAMRKRHWTATGIEPGDVIAVEGKLHANITVLRQATPPHRRRWVSIDCAAADFYAVVLPRFDSDLAEVARALGICCIEMRAPFGDWRDRHSGLLRFDINEALRCHDYPRVRPTHLDIAVTPGLPAPRALTPWKLAAVRFCIDFGPREFVAKDVPSELNLRTFVDHGWATLVRREGRAGVYALVDHPGRPDRVYPEIVAALHAELGAS